MQKLENALWPGKCLLGEMSIRDFKPNVAGLKNFEICLRASVRSGNCLFGEMSVREVSVGEVSVGDLNSGKCQSGKCPVEKLSYNRST